MLSLKVVLPTEVSRFFVDFQKHSKCFEMPPDNAEYIGIFNDNKLAGYFVAYGYGDTVEINQGYLRPGFRHKDLPIQCLRLFEELCKHVGYKKVYLCTQNRFRSYFKFTKALGYRPEKVIFKKDLGE